MPGKGKSKGKEQARKARGYTEGGCVSGFLGKVLRWLREKQGDRTQARSTHCLPHLYEVPSAEPEALDVTRKPCQCELPFSWGPAGQQPCVGRWAGYLVTELDAKIPSTLAVWGATLQRNNRYPNSTKKK